MSPGRLVLSSASLFLAAAVVVSLGAEPATARAAQGDDDRGERLMNAGCQGCHELRVLQVQAKNLEEWTKTIDDMVAKGAKVAKEDIPALADYLVDHHGPLPNGAGKAVVLNVCTMCHDLKRIRFGRRSPEEWEETLNAMLNEGAPLPDDQFPVVHAYLSRHFGVE